MEKKESFFNRLLKLFTSREESEQKLSDDISEEKEGDCLSLEAGEAKEAAALPSNLVIYDNESYLIIEANHTFYGNIDYPDYTSIVMSFEFPVSKKATTLYINCYLPLSEEEILPGIYPFDEELSFMSMDGSIHLLEEENDEYQSKNIEIVSGSLEVKKEGEAYLITGDFQTIDNNTLTIHYEGGLRFRKEVSPPNGKGGFGYEGRVYLFDTVFEKNEGMKSEYILVKKEYEGIQSSLIPERKTYKREYMSGYWQNQIEIELKSEAIMGDTQYKILFKVGMEKGDRLLPGEYACSEEKYHPAPGTFIGKIMLAKEDDEEYTVFRIVSGNLLVERDEYLIFKGEFTLENGKPLVLSYTGKPQWNDHS